MTKQELRKIYFQKRQALSEAEYEQLNFQLAQNFFLAFDLTSIKVFHVFLPIPSKKEVDTWPIIDRIQKEYPHIRISIPKVNSQSGELNHFYFEGHQQLATNEWGIQEPIQGTPTKPGEIDLVLVPLLAFDLTGHRVGYGKGYYDKFLVTCRPDCKKIGVSLFTAEAKIDDTNTGDVKLNQCITPFRGYQFS